MENTLNLSIIPILNCREWKYKNTNLYISSFPTSSSNISPYHSPSYSTSSFPNSILSPSSFIQLMFNCLALSLFHIPLLQIPSLLHLIQTTSSQCTVQGWGEKETKSVSLVSILTSDNTELKDCMKSSLAFPCPKAHWWKNFSLNLYWTFASILWMVYILANYKPCLFWQIMSYQKLKRQLVKESI